MNYNSFYNKPTLNHKELIGDNKASDIGGMTEEDMQELLKTDLTPYYSKDEIDDLFTRSFVYREKSGPIVTFDCPSTSQSIPSLTVGIEATQDLHGYDYPWAAGGGKNKCNAQNPIVLSQAGNIGEQPCAISAGTYTFSWTSSASTAISLTLWNGSTQIGTFSSTSAIQGRGNLTFTITENATYLKCYFNGATTVSDIQVESGSTATSFVPYSNICPISGKSAVNVYDGPTTDPQDATVYTTALKDENDQPLTCYGGQLENVNGVQTLVLTHGYIASYNGETLPSTWISDRDVYSEGATPTTGAQVVYTLTTPTEIPQQSQAISTQSGTNNLWADSGDIEVKCLDRIIPTGE